MTSPQDIVIYGATGFVGRLTAAYLAGAAPAGTRIALAGRSADKLARVRDELGVEWDLVLADSGDPAALAELAAAARVVVTTVGPYDRYGLPLVQACAEAGTHYADLTGEVPFMRRSIDAAHAAAGASGARIVHACGFDSIPSDLALWALQREAGEELADATLVVTALRGGVSGGTVASIRGVADAALRDTASRKALLDPFSLSPARAADPPAAGHRDPAGVVRSSALGGFLAPFLMGPGNARVVRRSNALLDHRYGRDMRYRELMLGGTGALGAAKAVGMTGGILALTAGMALPPTRFVLDRVLPDPGEGPSESTRESGFFAIDTHVRTVSGRRFVCRVRAQGDPGYKATAVMLGESALALASDGESLPDRAGVLTPATGIGRPLLDRLRAAGHSYDVAPL